MYTAGVRIIMTEIQVTTHSFIHLKCYIFTFFPGKSPRTDKLVPVLLRLVKVLLAAYRIRH
jgi:hypothetical protein